MAVAASLPNILKVFPLKVVTAREGFSTPQRDVFLSGREEAVAAFNADEEMEEGEIDTREAFFSSSIVENVMLPSLPQHPCCADLPPGLACIEDSTTFATSAVHHSLPRLSSMTDHDLQLEQPVDALLSLPDKLSSQGESKFSCNDKQPRKLPLLSQSGQHYPASSPVKNPGSGFSLSRLTSTPDYCQRACSTSPKGSRFLVVKGAPLLNEIQVPSPSQVSWKEAKTPPKKPISAPKATQVSSGCVPSQPKRLTAGLSEGQLLLALPAQRADSFLSLEKLQVSFPSSTQPQTSSTVLAHQSPGQAVMQHSSELPTPVLEVEFPANPRQQHLIGSDLSFKELQESSQLDSLPVLSTSKLSACTAMKEWICPQSDCMEVANQLKQQGQAVSVARELPMQTLSPQRLHHLSPSNLLDAQSSAPDSRAQVSVDGGTFAVDSSIQQRTYISCASGKRRPRSSAVRDYPEGCGSVFSATANQVSLEQPLSDSSHDKTTLKVRAVNNHTLSGPRLVSKAEQGQRKEDLLGPLWKVVDVSCDLKPRVPSARDEAAPCLYKSQKVSVLPLKRRTAPNLLLKKSENQFPKECLLGITQKKRKVRPLSSIVSCGMDGFPPSIEERSSQIQCFSKDGLLGYNGLTSKVSPGKPHGRPGLPMPSRGFQNSVVLHDSLPHADICGASLRFQVKRTLQEFDCVRRSLAMAKDRHQRPDLAAARILKNKGRYRNCGVEKIIGDVPGVEVGDQFSFRIEMLIVGLHRQVQGGIDFISGNVRLKGPLATSIVASGGYEDDDDFGATFIYTGQGGNNYKGDRRQGRDQELKRGNLALSNSYKERTPVRVIRGSNDDKFYTYDGLYDVIDCWFQTGIAGFGVFQFKLSRRPGQPELVSSIVRFMGTVKKKGLARPHLLLGDISCGKERLPVSVANEVDEEASPQNFTYISKMKYPTWYNPQLSTGCDCVGGCVDASKCLCAAKNGGEFPYNEVGQIVVDKKVVFECGKSCACPSSCYNRVSQKGSKHQLEVFKTKNRGWGVRSLEPIRPGDFICEYVGELLSDSDAEQRTGRDEYLFDIGHRANSWMDISDLMDVSKGQAITPVVEDEGFTIDARLFGSVARFINHSCSPNLYAQDVVYDIEDLRFPHVMLFAMESIPPLREMSYDYNYSIGHVRDANGNVKSKTCYCGAQDCRGRLY